MMGKVLNTNAHALSLSTGHEDTSADMTLPVPRADCNISGKPKLMIVAYKPRCNHCNNEQITDTFSEILKLSQ